MQDNNITAKSYLDEEVDFIDLIYFILSKWQIILCVSVVAFVATYLGVSQLPNEYKSEVLVSPVSSAKSSPSNSAIGGLAALSGINLGGGDDKTQLALATLESRKFIVDFINEHNLKPAFWAATGWDQSNNELTYDDELYDNDSKSWKESEDGLSFEPSDLQVYAVFLKDFFTITQDKDSSFVTITLTHYSPLFAKETLDKLVDYVNQYFKYKEINDAEKSISYYQNRIETQALESLNQVLYKLIEEEEKKKMMATTREEAMFEVVDPPFIAEYPFFPRKGLFSVLAAVAALVLTSLVLMLRYILITLSNQRSCQK
ncbi:hypothetical protein [Pseudoalteromonas rubra]|uniref:hypothetical protein n=1 Tax=Pseudoalteromonas rubra TaxID=43658 RepID=UPI0013DE249E|nr:hypothetical protein [Pseudoalteromonas rubra]MEC4089912.1 hypothetical protein [Pseudoalteromonas rubra]